MRALFLLAVLPLALASGAAPVSAAALVITVPPRAQAASDAPRVRAAAPDTSTKRAKYRTFSLQDEESVRAYFRGQDGPSSAPSDAVAKRASLGQPLPEDIARVYLPLAVEAALPIYPNAGYYLIGRDVVLIDTTTRIVVDILKDVFG